MFQSFVNEFEQALKLIEQEGYESLRIDPDEPENSWEVVRIESMGSQHVSYGFKSNYNDLLVGGLTSLELAKAMKMCKMISSYVDMELERRLY